MRGPALIASLFVLSLITYIDRVCISSAKDPISADLALSDSAMGLVFGAFALGYALAQIPGGWIADRYGPRLALALVVTAWSIFTALTGAAWSLTSLVAIRFIFGVGEAGAFPGSSRAFYDWLPASDRGRAHGILFSGSRLGAALSFPLLAWMMGSMHWRTVFYVLGAAGVVWAAYWWFCYRDHPDRTAPAAAGDFTLRQVFTTRAFLGPMAQYFASNFTFFICLTWMHPFLKRQYSLTDAETAAYAMIPLLMGAASQWVTGFWVDVLYRSPRMKPWSRRLPAMAGFAVAALGIAAAAWMPTAPLAVACFTLATFGADMTISPSWSYCADIAGKNSGSVSASMNMVGNIGSFVSANAFPLLLLWTGSAAAYFTVAAVLNLLAVWWWRGMRSPSLETR